jgi:cGMP-dependent protein kinase
MKLIKSFKDSEKVYFLLEYVAGITLFEVSNKLSAFSTEDCKFYASCLILALTYMHEREVVYRDLKPENILIDSEGYPKLIDFGTAKVIQDRTFTVLGTPHYMAPEIILFKGYSFEVDYWALGVVLYECLFGVLPFGHDKDDPYEIFQCILEKTLKFPDVRSDLNARAFIAQLLSQTPGERVVGGIDKLIKHPWFGDVNCLEILSRAVKPPFVPDRIDVQEGYACDLAEFISKQSRDCPVLRTRTKEITEDWDESI